MSKQTKMRFKNSYDGYFKDLKGKILTVKEKMVCTEGDAKYWYVFNEIKENHLIKSHWLEEVKE